MLFFWNRYGTQDNFTVYYNDYVKLYIDTIQTEFKRITPNRIYLSSSPSNGKESISEGYVAQNPGDYNYGDGKFLFLINVYFIKKNYNFCMPAS